jgi:hypothetical protein
MKFITLFTTIALTIFIMMPVMASADDGICTTTQEIGLSIHFMGDMLKILSVTLQDTEVLLSSHQEEYPFLKDLIFDTNTSEHSVQSMINATDSDWSNIDSVAKNVQDLHNNLQSPNDLMNMSNETLGHSDITNPVFNDMYGSVKDMSDISTQDINSLNTTNGG